MSSSPREQELLAEVAALRQRLAALEAAEAQRADAEETARAYRVYAESIIETSREALLVLDADLRVKAANPLFYRTFDVLPAETEGRSVFELGAGQWNVPALRTLLLEIVPHNTTLEDFELELDIPNKGRRIMRLSARRIERLDTHRYKVLLVMQDITATKQAQQDNHRLHEELEDRVRARTADLETANKELEAFSYSVSHDLRSPLRALDGYARILLEEYAATFPPGAQEFIRDIRRNSQKMGHLIDDLLTFSRLGRQELQKRHVAMDRLVRNALETLSHEREGRQIEIVVGELPACLADPALLTQVWINLLGNAIKYTRKCPVARIEVGSLQQDGAHIYVVRDNGAGFDMKFAGKLFGVFQRLHKASEYDGTGVGLAIVQRIVHRHGGRVWAEAVIHQGATFYFTIP